MPYSVSRIALVAALVLLDACRTAHNEYAPATFGQPNILTREELATVGGTAYSAVERLRPLFLNIRPGSRTLHAASPRLHVFIDGDFAGGIDALNALPVATVESIWRVEATIAFTRYGAIRAADGVILVRLRR